MVWRFFIPSSRSFFNEIQTIKIKRDEISACRIMPSPLDCNLAPKHLNHHLQRDTTECLINVLPMAKISVSCNSLLHLLKVGLTIKINSELFKL